MNPENNVLTIKTIQIQPVRNMIAALKELLTDATITIYSGNQPTVAGQELFAGIKIVNFDKSHTTLVSVELHANQFETFTCIPNKIIICANTLHLNRVISTITNNDILSLYIEKDDYHDGSVSELGLQFDDVTIKQCYNQKLKLIEPDTEEMVVPDVDYSTIINLSSSYFQKIIRDFYAISERIEIKSVGNELIFSCQGLYAKSRIYRTEAEGLTFCKKPDDSVIIQGEFSLKSLNNFIKCTPLCSHLEIYLGNDKPLIVKYNVASLGEIKLCLASLTDE